MNARTRFLGLYPPPPPKKITDLLEIFLLNLCFRISPEIPLRILDPKSFGCHVVFIVFHGLVPMTDFLFQQLLVELSVCTTFCYNFFISFLICGLLNCHLSANVYRRKIVNFFASSLQLSRALTL